MFKRVAVLFMFAFLPVFFGACSAPGSWGTFTYNSDLIQPRYSMSVINNTPVLLDIEINGRPVKRNLTPGETFVYDLWYIPRDGRVRAVAKGHVEDNQFVGVEDKTLRFSSRRGLDQEVWIVDRLEGPDGRFLR